MRVTIILTVPLVLTTAIFSGCANADNMPLTEKVILKLKWVNQAQFAGNYVAKRQGFYNDEGLDVEIVPLSYDEPTIDAVSSGNAEFGITGADELLLARAAGKPLKAIDI